MNPTYAVYTHIDRPIEEVFQAVVKRDAFIKVFAESSSGDLEEGATVVWGMGASKCSVQVHKVIENERIEIGFRPAEFAIPLLKQGDKRDYEAKLVFLFEVVEVGGTLVTLCEYGWQRDGRSILQSYGHCAGWQEMLDRLKVLMMYDIDIRSPAKVGPNYQALWTEAPKNAGETTR